MTAMAIGPEMVTRLTPLGLRLWDTVTQAPVTDGLSLKVAGAPPASVSIAINPSGVFVLSNLPGLAASEEGDGGPGFWASPPVTASFTITVDDSRREFIPCSVTVSAPTRGVLGLPCPVGTWAPPMALAGIPLFSSPARQLLPGMGAIRAQIWDTVADVPAAFAMLEIDTGTPPAPRGLADEQGRVLVAVPYPPLPSTLTSPPAGQSLSAQSWPVTPRVYYSAVAGASGTPGHPDLCTLLNQPAATALGSASPPSPAGPASLAYGVELVLTTPGGSTLLIEPGAAP
jgi:hypothetical protein